MTKRRFWLLVHRVNGLLIAVFVTLVGLTGSLLAWKAPLERLFAPALFVLAPYRPDAVRVDPLRVRENVVRAFPWASVDSLDLSTVAGAPLEFSLTPTAADSPREANDEAFADPYTGRVLGSRRYADLSQGWINFVPFVYILHQNLALGDVGEMLLGLAALLWTLDCFVGMYLTFPASHRWVAVSRRQRLTQWPTRWKRSWLVRWRAGSFKRLYDLHRAAGLWLWAMLLVFAWSGVAFNLPGVYRPVMHLVGASETTAQPALPCRVTASPETVPWGGALAAARQEMNFRAQRQGFRVLSERFLSHDSAACRWTYRVRSTLDVDQIGNTQLVWQDGEVARAAFSAPTGGARADTFTTWIEAMHEAQVGGAVMRTIVCLGGLVAALLSITGVWIFMRKLNRSALTDSRGRQ